MVVSPSHSMFSTLCLFKGWLSCVTSLAGQRNFKPLFTPGVQQVDEAALTAGSEVHCPSGCREAEAWIQCIHGEEPCPGGCREAEA